MRVFISWSGDRSRAVAELLDEWIQCVLQAIRPWMSSKDIDRGSLWFSEISDQLKDTKIGIVCLTKDNLNKPWILFESGALAKGLSSARVCTLLIDIETTDVANPLAQFNHTMPDKDGIYELVRTLNSSLGDSALREKVLEQVFETYWPQFERDFSKALENNPAGNHTPPRTEENILSEVLRTIRLLDRRMRSIESAAPSDERRSSKRKDWSPAADIRRQIRRLVVDGIPEEVIVEIIAGSAPSAFIDKTIREVIAEMEDDPMTLIESAS